MKIAPKKENKNPSEERIGDKHIHVFGKFSKKGGTGIKLKDCEDLPENWKGFVL